MSVDGGFSCPNVDGTLGTGGCVFCNISSFSPSRRERFDSITQQIDRAVQRLGPRHRAERFVAYFQPATNTHAPVERLRDLYTEALKHPAIVGVSIGTRPDCVNNDVLDLLAELAERTWISLEYGLQTIHDRSLDWLGRGHRYAAFLDAYRRTRDRGLSIGVHLILGIPGESRDEILSTAREMARLQVDAVKLHNLYVVRDTVLATRFASGEVPLPSFREYVELAVDFLERLPPTCVIDRLCSDATSEYLIAPQWMLEKSVVSRAIEAEFADRGSWQGKHLTTSHPSESEP